MDSLIAKADAIQRKRRKFDKKHTTGPRKPDQTLASITKHTSIPRSLLPSSSTSVPKSTHPHIQNKKLRATLNRQAALAAQSQELLKDAGDLLLMEEAGKLEVEGEMEKTWRVGQEEIVKGSGEEAAKGRREWKLGGGPYRSRYTRNGRHIAIVGRTGHAATFDWQTGTLHAELQLQETCRDITFLHDQSHFAVAQKKYVFIYDRDGVELHCLKSHIEATRLEFLPYHWLLASVGNSGYLKYQDTSTGQLLVSHRTKLGSVPAMAQNPHTAVLYLGHQNGCVTLWTPNLPHAAVTLLAHLGPVAGVSIDPSSAGGGGRYMATSGVDGTVKVWDCRNWRGAIREWRTRGGGAEVEWSQRGTLAVASGGSVNVYNTPTIHTPFPAPAPPPLYLTHPITQRPITSLRFAPFQDVLTIGHARGLSSVLVPGAGEPNFDSAEADPFEGKKARREREVRGLLDKVQPDLITLNPEFAGSLAPPSNLNTSASLVLNDGKSATTVVPFARLPRLERLRIQGVADETEVGVEDIAENGDKPTGDERNDRAERERRKVRGKGKSVKRYLRKQRKNVIDPTVVAIRTKLEKQKQEKRRALAAKGDEGNRKPSALDRFKRTG